MSDDTDLSLVSTEALIDELFKRHDAVLIVRSTEKVKGKTQTLYDYSGTLMAAIGMAEYAKHWMMETQFRPTEDQ